MRVLWSVVIPVKPAARGKSRLRGATVASDHEHLARALALDTIAVALACPLVSRVLVVTDDKNLPRLSQGAECVADPRSADPRCADPRSADLNAAIRHGESLLRPRNTAIVALTADLPALRVTDLSDALRAAAAHSRAFVADAEGTGTVLLASTSTLRPHFGPGSAKAHAASGATPLTQDWPSLRRDVDTPGDLAEAAQIGLGAHTSGVLGLDTPVGPPDKPLDTRGL